MNKNFRRACVLLAAPLLAVLLGAVTCEGDQCPKAGEYHYRAEQKDFVCKDVGNGELRWVKVKKDDL